MSEKRFATLADSDIQKLVEDKDSVNTKRQVKLSKNLFLQFIGEIDADMAAVLKMECRPTVSVIDKTSLDKYLGQFCANVRTKTGEHFKKSSLLSIRFGLYRFLQEATGFDVNKDEHFSNSRRIFSAVLAETKRKGLGVITHKPPIAPEDLQKLYEPTHGTFSVENPVGLQCKVGYDINDSLNF